MVQLIFILADLAAAFLRSVLFKTVLTWLSIIFYMIFFFVLDENHP